MVGYNTRVICRALLLAALLSFFASCMPEVSVVVTDDGLVNREFEASFADGDTKTTLVNGSKVQWYAGDIVRYYSRLNGQVRQVAVSKAGASAHFTLKTDDYSKFIAAVYGADIVSSDDVSWITLDGVVRAEQSGRFADAHVSIAYTNNLESGNLQFYNFTSLLSFDLQRNDVAYVLFKPASPIRSGKVRVPINYGSTTDSFDSSVAAMVDAIKVFTSSGASKYFISLFPGTITGGFELLFYDYSNTLLGSVSSSKDITLNKNTILNLGLLDGKLESPEHLGGKESGLYMGVTGFNAFLYKYPIQSLKSDSVSGYYSFIDGLPQKNVTMLYYSVKDAINTLQYAEYPEDLSTVAIVTFTDGEDDGSVDYESYMGTEAQYLSDVNSLLYNSIVHGHQIKSWTIGLQSDDASNPGFLSHLQKLSRPASNGVRVSSMSAVNQQFQAIADELINSFNVYNMTVRIAGKSYGQRIRFTLDANVSNPAYSTKYIDGYYNNQTKTLYDVSYHGLSTSSGSEVNSTFIEEDRLYEFSFMDLVPNDNSELLASNILQWTYESDNGYYWKRRSEMESDENRRIETIRKSAVILLNLDCTTSLNGTLFTELKSHAKDFIARLKDAAYSPNVVSNILLDKSKITLGLAASAKLTATIEPSTATNKNVNWSSSNPQVATVDEGGVVKGIKAGVATITATTEMGNKQAICNVSVVEPEIIDLGLSVKWASWNVGASAPEEYGDYFAWGETAPKQTYSWSTYKWCNGSYNSLTKYNTSSSYGSVDNRTVLELSDDAARANWGGSWRMPTDAEWTELIDNCTWTWMTQNGVKGRLVISKTNSNSIFLPAAGFQEDTSHHNAEFDGRYWSSSLSPAYPSIAFPSTFYSGQVSMDSRERFYGHSVRPVTDEGVNQEDPVVQVSAIALNRTSIQLEEGESEQLLVSVLPANASDPSVTWTSSDPRVATVSEDGVVYAVFLGTCTIRATSNMNANVYEECIVSVFDKVQQVSIHPDNIELNVGDSQTLYATVNPPNVYDASVEWRSSNNSVASVSSSGRVTALSVGSATITATSVTNPNAYGQCTVSVKAPHKWGIEDWVFNPDYMQGDDGIHLMGAQSGTGVLINYEKNSPKTYLISHFKVNTMTINPSHDYVFKVGNYNSADVNIEITNCGTLGVDASRHAFVTISGFDLQGVVNLTKVSPAIVIMNDSVVSNYCDIQVEVSEICREEYPSKTITTSYYIYLERKNSKIQTISFAPNEFRYGHGIYSFWEFYYSGALNDTFPYVKTITSANSGSFLVSSPVSVKVKVEPEDANIDDYDWSFANTTDSNPSSYKQDLIDIYSLNYAGGYLIMNIGLKKLVSGDDAIIFLKAKSKDADSGGSYAEVVSDYAYVRTAKNYQYRIIHKKDYQAGSYPKCFRWNEYVPFDAAADLSFPYNGQINLADYVDTYAVDARNGELLSSEGITPSYEFYYAGTDKNGSGFIYSNVVGKASYLDSEKTDQNYFVTLNGSIVQVNSAFVSTGSPAIGRTPLFYVRSVYQGKVLAEALIKLEIVAK